MRAANAVLGSMVAVALLLAFAGASSAVSETIGPGDSFEKKYTAETMDYFSVSWTSSGGNVHFTVTDPDGFVLRDTTGIGDVWVQWVSEPGTYTLEWENDGTSDVTVDYVVSGVGEVESAIDALVWGMIIGGIVIVVIIVLVVVLVVMGGKKKKAAMAPQATMPMGPPVVDGKCVRCGNPVDPTATWCPKCGAPLR